MPSPTGTVAESVDAPSPSSGTANGTAAPGRDRGATAIGSAAGSDTVVGESTAGGNVSSTVDHALDGTEPRNATVNGTVAVDSGNSTSANSTSAAPDAVAVNDSDDGVPASALVLDDLPAATVASSGSSASSPPPSSSSAAAASIAGAAASASPVSAESSPVPVASAVVAIPGSTLQMAMDGPSKAQSVFKALSGKCQCTEHRVMWSLFYFKPVSVVGSVLCVLRAGDGALWLLSETLFTPPPHRVQ